MQDKNKFKSLKLAFNGSKNIGSGVLIKTIDNKLLLQKRDARPDILFPGYWSFFTGGIEPEDVRENIYETARQIARREIAEELSVLERGIIRPLNTSGLKLIGAYQAHDRFSVYFAATTQDCIDNITLHEGERLGTVSLDEVLQINMVPTHRMVAQEYLKDPDSFTIIREIRDVPEYNSQTLLAQAHDRIG